MLQSLRISNFVLVKEFEINFTNKLQVLTGETGAGKSIIIGALNLILGAQVKNGMLFDKENPAILEAVFSIPQENKALIELLEKHSIDLSEGEIFISKEISRNYKGKSFINGRRVTINIIKEFRDVLFDFHSQRDHILLFDKKYQLDILDRFGNLISFRDEYSEKYLSLKSKQKELAIMLEKEQAETERIQLYKFQIKEIEEAQLQIGEDENLQHERNLLSHSEDILKLSNQIENDILESENSITDRLNFFVNKLDSFASDNQHISKAIEFLNESLAYVNDAVQEVGSVAGMLNVDPYRVEEIDSRLDLINTLKNKYNKGLEEILEYEKELSEKIKNHASFKNQIKKLEQEIEILKKEVINKGEKLSKARKKAALVLSKEIILSISRLAIPDARFEITFDKNISEDKKLSPLENFSVNGKDSIEFKFAANLGSSLLPIKQSISGGELSRLLLTIKKILSDKITKRTIVFDEIDSGIGGKTADRIGEFISDISKNHQILCITHLPQIAVFAEKHFFIKKVSDNKTAEIKIDLLDKKDRHIEIARMLSGSSSEIALQHAEEMLKRVK